MTGTCEICKAEHVDLECYYNDSTGEEVWCCWDCDPNEED